MKKLICVLLAWAMLFTVVPTIEVQAATKLSKPMITSVVESSGAKVTIKWKKNSSAKGYVIYRKTGKNGKYKKLKTIANNKTVKYVDTSTKDNTTYYYAVRSYKGKSYSSYSAAKKIKTAAAAKIQDVYNDCAGVLADTPTKVTFTASISNGIRLKDKSLALYKGNTLVGYFVDNGKNGDGIAGDGQFTTVDTLNIGVDEYADYHVKYKKKEVESFSIRAFDAVTDADMQDMQKISEEIDFIAKQYEVDDYVPSSSKENAINAVYERAKDLKDDNKILTLRKNDYGVSIQLPSGIWYYYSPAEENVNSNTNKSVVTIQTFNLSGGEAAHPTELIDSIADRLSEKMSNVRFDDEKNLDDEEVTPASLDRLSANQIVIWDGHGGYDDEVGELLITGMYLKDKDDITDTDLLTGCVWFVDGDRLIVTPKWFNHNMSNNQLENSVFFITTCFGGRDERLAQALISKGASSVVAFTSSVYTYYGWHTCEDTFAKMTEVNDDTGYYYTLGEAVESASDIWGDNDISYANKYHPEVDTTGRIPAYITVFGEKDYRISDENFATLELSEKSLKLEEGKSVKLNAISNILNEKNIKWSISDSGIATLSKTDGNSVTVKAKKAGKATVVCCVGDKKVICNLTVTRKDVNKLSDGLYLIEHFGNDAEKCPHGASCKSAKISGNKLTVIGSLDYVDRSDWSIQLVPYKSRTFTIDKNCEFSWGYTGPNGMMVKVQRMGQEERFNYFFNNTDNNGALCALEITNGKITRIEYERNEGD